jgi:hypothetical protein
MNLIEKVRRWFTPGEFDDERPPSDGEGYALSDREYEAETEKGAEPIIRDHGARN